ncbi:hypothetical protein [Paraburkholderia silvatlantica]|uniref:hypothetical protein n=1 Tax=Paraburkholderia silvatlantica TaxID=321895 RepID=UPI0011B675CB|nr:hypothetical protein [Paraburkholderia silvatlantica]
MNSARFIGASSRNLRSIYFPVTNCLKACISYGLIRTAPTHNGLPREIVALEDVLETEFTHDERTYLEVRMRAIFESGKQFGAERIAYLVAKRP